MWLQPKGSMNISEHLPIPLIGLSLQGEIILWNAASEKLFEYTKEEAIGSPVSLLIPDDTKNEFEGLFSALQAGQTIEIETIRISKSGKRIPVRIFASVQQDEQRTQIMVATLLDLSQENKFKQRFRTAVEASPSGILLVDRNSHIHMANRSSEAIFGFRENELLGQSLERILPELKYPIFPSGNLQPVNSCGLRRDGQSRSVQVSFNPVEIESGQYVLVSIADITDLLNVQSELEKSNLALQKRTEEIEYLVYAVSHDLKSPLVTSAGYLTALREDLESGDDAAVLDDLTRLERANKTMTVLIGELMQYNRLGRAETTKQWLNTSDIVESLFDSIPPNDHSQPKLACSAPMPPILASRDQFEHALVNLLSNAIKHGNKTNNLSVTVGARRRENTVDIFVRDTGPGIPEKDQERIFGLFERASAKTDGTGLGLAIVAKVAENHEGSAWVESELGVGSTFWMSFPTPERTQAQ